MRVIRPHRKGYIDTHSHKFDIKKRSRKKCEVAKRRRRIAGEGKSKFWVVSLSHV
jgi:hypothetical protein